MADNISTYYGTDPWEGIATNQRTWYDPTLRRVYRQNTVFTDLIPYATQPMLPNNARTMILNMGFDFVADTTELAWRDYTKDRMTLDGQQVEITFGRYGAVTAMHKSDDLVNYWMEQGQSEVGLMPIIRERLARNIVDVHDKLIRNAFLGTSYVNLASSAYTGADQIVAADVFTVDMIDDAILRAQVQNVWTSPSPKLGRGALLCIDSPGQISSILTGAASTKWVELQKYASLAPFNEYEIGSYHNSRHLQTPACILWNCGATAAQTTITASCTELDGSPDPALTKVDGVYKVGQASTAAVHYITVSSSAAFAVGDMITISKGTNQAAAVTANPKLRVLGAPPYDEGTAVVRRVVAKDTGKLMLDRPLGIKYSTEVATTGTGVATPSSGVYGFVTRGQNLHVSIMIAAPEGVVCGMALPPRVHSLPPIDDFESVWRFSWDSYEGFQIARPEAYEIFVTAGPARVKNVKYT